MLLGLLGLITVLRKVYCWVCDKKLNRWIFGKVTSKKVVVSCTFFVFRSVEAKRTMCTSNQAGWTVCGASVMSTNQPRFAKHSTPQTITGHFYNALEPIHTTTPDTTKLSRLCGVRFGGVNWIPDNSRLSPKSDDGVQRVPRRDHWRHLANTTERWERGGCDAACSCADVCVASRGVARGVRGVRAAPGGTC